MSAAASVVDQAAGADRRHVTREQALAHYDGLVFSFAHRFAGNGAELDDLVQEGRLGIMTAVTHWHEETGAPFGAFVALCIRNAVGNAAQTARRQARWSVYRSLDEQRDEGRPLHEVIGKPATQEDRSAVARLRHAISQLPDRERTILEGVADGFNYEEIGQRLNLTGCRVRQITVAVVEELGRRHAPRRQDTAHDERPALSKKRPPRSERSYESQGRTMSMRAWAREVGISHTTIQRRLKEGWTFEAAITTAVEEDYAARRRVPLAKEVNLGSKRQLLTLNGRSLTKAQWARESGISYTTLCRRLDGGCSLEAAISTPAVIGRPPRALDMA